jgi:hypothetical protein
MLLVILSVAMATKVSPCYTKISECSECYVLFSDFANANLPDSIKRCLINETEINLHLNDDSYTESLNFIYLLANHNSFDIQYC